MSDRPPVKVKFIGGAQEQYDSLKDLTTAAMDMHSSKWKDYSDPKSYMFPPVFSYDMPQVSDHAIEEAKKNAQEQDGSTADSKGSGSTCQQEGEASKKEFQEQKWPNVAAHETSKTCQEESKDFKKTNQEKDGSTSEAQESASSSQKEKKALKKKSQQQEGSTPVSKGNSSGSTSQKPDFLRDPTKVSFFAGIRVGDTAEHIVYDALESVSHLESISPMIIINNLDLKRIKESEKALIFQNGDELYGEYDFVIIGPKVGIVVIEVKNANKSSAGSQLRSFDKVIDYLKKEYPEVHLPADYLGRKLLIFTNSTKSSHKQTRIDHGNQQNSEVNDQAMVRKPQEQEVYLAESEGKSSCSTDQMTNSLPEAVKSDANNVKRFDSMGNNLRIWDKDDIKNRTNHISKPSFYSMFCDFFHETGYSISKEVYKSFAPVLVGLYSFLTFKTSSNSVNLKLDLLKVSESASLTVDAERLRSKDQKAVAPITKEENVRDFTIVVLPTPDQQRALESPSPRQFIIGLAGTGKSIILQQKAIKMLKGKKKVLILTTSTYMEEFKKFLKINSPEHKNNVDYLIVDWWTSKKTKFFKKIYMMGDLLKSKLEKVKMDKILLIKNWLEGFEKRGGKRKNKSFDNFDCILIDDACDQLYWADEDGGDDEYYLFSRFGHLCTAVIIMAIFEKSYPSKTLWIAMDLVLPPLGRTLKNIRSRFLHAQVINCLLSNSTNQNPGYPFTTVVLNQIMRYSENIFKFAYTMDVLSQLRIRPIMGHKIVGKAVTEQLILSTRLYDGTDEIPKALWIQVKKVLDQIQIPLKFVCILVGGEHWDEKELLRSFERKCIECSIPTTSTPNKYTVNEALQSRTTGGNENSEALFLDFWYNVSSREWPIVIFCSITNKSTWKDGRDAIQRYRAYSRATVKLYEVSVRYPSSNEACCIHHPMNQVIQRAPAQDAETLMLGPSTDRRPTLKRSKTVYSFDLDTRILWTDIQVDLNYWASMHYRHIDQRAARRQNNRYMQSSGLSYSLSDTWFPSVYEETC